MFWQEEEEKLQPVELVSRFQPVLEIYAGVELYILKNFWGLPHIRYLVEEYQDLFC